MTGYRVWDTGDIRTTYVSGGPDPTPLTLLQKKVVLLALSYVSQVYLCTVNVLLYLICLTCYLSNRSTNLVSR